LYCSEGCWLLVFAGLVSFEFHLVGDLALDVDLDVGWLLAVGYGMLAMGCCFTACVVGHAKLQLHFTGKHFLLPLFQHSPTPSTQSANRSNQFVAVRIRFYFIAIRFTSPLLWVQISFQHDASFKPN